MSADRANWKDRVRILAAIAVLSILVISSFYLWRLISNASDNIVAVILTGFVSIITIFFGRYLEQSRDIQQRTNLERIRIYQDIISTFMSVFSKKAAPATDGASPDIVENLRRIQSELLFWGSDSVILAWEALNLHLRKTSTGTQEDGIKNLATALGLLGRLTIAMRRDVGYPNTKITEENYARLTLSDGEAERALIDLMKFNLKDRDRRKQT